VTTAADPSVSVLMPVRDEAGAIGTSLGAVLAQDYPADRYEVLVLDGGSTDGTPDVVRGIAAAHAAAGPSPDVRVLDNPGGIVPTGMNIGIAAARGEVVVRVDGHCAVQADHVRRCVDLLASTGADNVGGLQVAEGQGVVSEAIALAVSSRFGVGDARFHYATEPGWVDTVYLGAYPRDVLVRLGGYDEEMVRNQDDELNLRLRQAGGRIWLDPAIRTRYENRATFRRLWRQYHQYGLYKVRVAQKRATLPSVRSLVPAAFVGALGVGIVAVRKYPVVTALVVVPYAVGNVAAARRTAAGAGKPELAPTISAAFATVHVAYGSGVIAGFWRWRRTWRDRATRTSLPPVSETGVPGTLHA
jgi:succinoglycan biosynthesis protein ExoA